MLSNHRECTNHTPAWLRELRLKKRNRQLQQQHSNQSSDGSPPNSSATFPSAVSSSSSAPIGGITTVQQPPPPPPAPRAAAAAAAATAWHCHTNASASGSDGANGTNASHGRCNDDNRNKMVQERIRVDPADQLIEKIGKGDDSDDSEELKYGPGIVSKLKNRYLSLTLREATAKSRPSILHLRKATSLEHILDDYELNEENCEKNLESGKTERLFLRHNGTSGLKNATNRYQARNVTRSEMKRARSVEIISDIHHDSLLTGANDAKTKQRESLHEETLLIEGNGDITCNTTDGDKLKTFHIEENRNFSNSIGIRLNRPRKIQPVMDEKEKPHPDIVKEKKKLFERPELRTKAPHATGEVAAKVAGFKNIIDSNKKPPLKQKPVVEKASKPDRTRIQTKTFSDKNRISSPIPPLRSPIKQYQSEIKEKTPPEETNGFVSLTDSSHRCKPEQIENFLKAEKEHGIVEQKNRINLEKSKGFDVGEVSPDRSKPTGGNSVIFSFGSPTKIKDHLPRIGTAANTKHKNETLTKINSSKQDVAPTKHKISPVKQPSSPVREKVVPTPKVPQNSSSTSPKTSPTKQKPSPTRLKNTNLSNIEVQHVQPQSVPTKESKVQSPTRHVENGVPMTEQLKIEIAGNSTEIKTAPLKKRPTSVPSQQKQTKTSNETASDGRNNSKLSDKVIEKNLINKLNGGSVKENGVVKNDVPVLMRKKPSPKKEQQNSLVFDFTSRKDVPDYVGNDGNIKPKEKMRPKPGEGGIIILPGATLDESLVDDDEDDWKRLLECPPSPCNVTFTNDNILIEGRSSLKTLHKPKMTIRFIDAHPEIFEYPSETSLLEDNSHNSLSSSSSLGHTVPSLSGSTLANYTPKSAFQVEEFQLGVKPSTNTTEQSIKQTEDVPDQSLELEETPILFSAGTNSDILF